MGASDDAKAVAFGACVTALLSATMVVAGLKAGITPGASLGRFQASVRGGGGRRFLNLAQVSGSAGMAIVSGVIFTAPLVQVFYLGRAQEHLGEVFGNGTAPVLANVAWGEAQQLIQEYGAEPVPPINIPILMIFCAAGALIGYGFVGISTPRFLSDPTLPAPEAHACNTMVCASAAGEGAEPNLWISLGLSTSLSFCVPLLTHLALAKEQLVLFSHSFGPVASQRLFQIGLPLSPVDIGIGGLLTASTALVTVAGAMVRLVGDALVASVAHSPRHAEMFPEETMRWVGGGAMTIGVLFSLFKFMRPMKRASKEQPTPESSLLDIPSRWMLLLTLSVGSGALLLATGMFATNGGDHVYIIVMLLTVVVMVSLMVTLGAILSLQIGSSASPVSGTIFVTTLVVCLVALALGRTEVSYVQGLAYMLVAACVAVSAANDASQDYKTVQLGGIPPHEAFIAQIVGLLAGTLVVPVALYVAHEAYGLGTERLAAPQGQLFSVLISGLLVDQKIPWWPVVIGLGFGAVAVTADILASRRGLQVPAMAFAVGLYLPPSLGMGILLGSISRLVGESLHEKDVGRRERTYESVLTAAGMITGAAFLDLLLGIAVLCGLDPDRLQLFASGSGYLESDTPTILAIVGFGVLAWLLMNNARHGVPEIALPEKALSDDVQSSSADSDSTDA
eukprot:CAMPEP_0117602530 /NCGR_PEP_ID=MMETSP0784-20121206/77633_1 /TAXON_ID=39447 /ORGANISM="" /LENGTH=677 /DNA_ID=CAMNT_0005405361 /DNA_START=137 /DNA_END=2171 /DNA_ORIENTATION=-